MSAAKKTPLCCIARCSNSVHGKVQSCAFYYVPKDSARAKKWTEIIKPRLVPGVPVLEALTCGKHFQQRDYVDYNANPYKLKPTALPSIFEGESSNPAKKIKIEIPTSRAKSTHIPLDNVVLNSPDTRVFVLEASMFSNNATIPGPRKIQPKVIPQAKKIDTMKPIPIEDKKMDLVEAESLEASMLSNNANIPVEPRKIQPKVIPQAKKIDTVKPVPIEDTKIDLVEAERLKQQIFLAKAKKHKLKEEYNKVVREEKKVLKEISGIEQELAGYKDKTKKFSQEELELLRKCYSPSQIRHLHGNKKANWTLDNLAMGFNITCMTSTNFYKYLREEMKFPLPGVSNITKCTKDLTDTSEKEDAFAYGNCN